MRRIHWRQILSTSALAVILAPVALSQTPPSQQAPQQGSDKPPAVPAPAKPADPGADMPPPPPFPRIEKEEQPKPAEQPAPIPPINPAEKQADSNSVRQQDAAQPSAAPVVTPSKPRPPAARQEKFKAVVAEPSVVYAGDNVTLRWYFTGKKVTVSGGRFGTGAVVTGRTAIADRPAKTTKYTFNVDYVGEKVNEETGQPEQKPLHATYSVVVEVAPPLRAELTTYRDRYGWQITCLKGWKRDVVSYPDPANNALIYFQQEDDSVERMAVSILPAEQMTATDLMSKVQKSLTGNYEQLQVLSDEETTFEGVPAIFSVFTGMDQSHPGTRTRSLLLAFVKNGRAYVVSARTADAQFRLRQPLLTKMVRSFTLAANTASK